MNLEERIKNFKFKAIKLHVDEFCYDIVDKTYINNKSVVEIYCNKCKRYFKQKAYKHLLGRKCNLCNKTSKSDLKSFIFNSNIKHNNIYDYSEFIYVNNSTKGAIICNKHGIFEQTPNSHLNGSGCPKCYLENKKLKQTNNKENFILKAKLKQNNKYYDYNLVKYKNSKTEVEIICHNNDKNGIEHGSFWQKPNDHLQGKGCPKCKSNNISRRLLSNKNDFINKSELLYGKDKFDFTNVEYKNQFTKLELKCLKHNIKFEITPKKHLNKKRGCGCFKCDNKLSTGEQEIIGLLENNKIKYIFEKRFDWLKHKTKMSLDFYLPEYNIAIEVQGSQHFVSDYFVKSTDFKSIIKRDKLKYKLCKYNNITLLYYSNCNKNILAINKEYMSKIYTDSNELLKKILN